MWPGGKDLLGKKHRPGWPSSWRLRSASAGCGGPIGRPAGRPYKKREDLDRIGSFQEIGAQLRASQSGYDVKSDYFSTRLSITVNDVTKTAWAVLRRDPGKGESAVLHLQTF